MPSALTLQPGSTHDSRHRRHWNHRRRSRRQLIAAGIKPRLLVRNPDKAKAFEGKAEIFKGDLDDAASVKKALEGCDHLFLVTSGLKHVVKLSVLGAEYEAISFGKWHRANEKKLEASGLQWTFLRRSKKCSAARRSRSSSSTRSTPAS